MTDFPDRDEWTDRPSSPESIAREQLAKDLEWRQKRDAEEAIEAEKAALEREKAEQRALYDEAAEWDGLGDTGLIGPEERQ